MASRSRTGPAACRTPGTAGGPGSAFTPGIHSTHPNADRNRNPFERVRIPSEPDTGPPSFPATAVSAAALSGARVTWLSTSSARASAAARVWAGTAGLNANVNFGRSGPPRNRSRITRSGRNASSITIISSSNRFSPISTPMTACIAVARKMMSHRSRVHTRNGTAISTNSVNHTADAIMTW